MILPIIVKLVASLVVIILINRYLKNLPASLFAGALFFAVWIGLSFDQIVTTGYDRLWSWNTAGLVALVMQVIILSTQMRKTGLINELVASIRGTFSPRTSLAVIPAVIGLLPMPGGALFSAPLLDNFDEVEGVDQDFKTRVNYWFRHVWEYAWPLYPGIIVACDIAGIELWQIMLFGFPVSLAAIGFGYIFFLSKIPSGKAASDQKHVVSMRPFLPLLTVIVIYAFFHLVFPVVGEINQYLPMVIGLFSSITLLQVQRPLSFGVWTEILRSKNIYKMLLIIILVRFYGAFVEADVEGFSVVQVMTQEMQQLGIPTLPLIILIPFFAGLTMGVSLGFAGSALPVVVALLGVSPSFGTLMGSLLLAYASGFMGTMLSPLHVCMIVTCEYYKTGLTQSFRAIIPPAVGIISMAFVYKLLLELIF